MSHTRTDYTYIDLFSGCGGLALGMHFAGWNAHFAVEKNQDAFLLKENNTFVGRLGFPKEHMISMN